MSEEPREIVPADLVPPDLTSAVEALPGLARIAAATALNLTQWGLLSGWRLSRRLVAAASDPDLARELAQELGLTVGVVVELARTVGEGVPLPQALVELGRITGAPASNRSAPDDAEIPDLRRRGEELLNRSRDVWNDDDAHPAYDRILDELAPDEARILLYLHRDGPQPAVDVRTGGPVGLVSSRLIAPGLTMIGARAGLRHQAEVPSYLNNLFRLGLVWFSRETLRDPRPYQVLEAQPDVLTAMHSLRLTKVVRRSIQLTPFGAEFVGAVLAPPERPDPTG